MSGDWGASDSPGVDTPVLEAIGLCVDYGRVRAVREVSLKIGRRERVAWIGANGAGKSSCLKALCGLVPPAAGQVLLDGSEVGGLPPYALARRGLGLVPEGRGVFGRLTALENLKAGAWLRTDHGEVARDIERLLESFPMLKNRLKEPAGVLSGGEQQALALARAFLGQPRILLLDEPSMGLAPLMVEMVFTVLGDLGRDTAMLLVEQNSHLALEFCHRAYALESGRVAAGGPSASLLANETIKELYLGGPDEP
jgi:branched-chain amino acid transport system ATP-binding protein